jgi:hypothetical protein
MTSTMPASLKEFCENPPQKLITLEKSETIMSEKCAHQHNHDLVDKNNNK